MTKLPITEDQPRREIIVEQNRCDRPGLGAYREFTPFTSLTLIPPDVIQPVDGGYSPGPGGLSLIGRHAGCRSVFLMPWFSDASPSPEDQFASEVIALVDEILGLEAERVDDFALRIDRPEGGPVTMNLHNIYAEAGQLDGDARAERLRKAVLAMMPPERPDTWGEAAPQLLPAVRTASWAYASAGDGRADVPAPFGRPLVPFVKVLCAIDSEHSIAFGGVDDLSAWGVSDDEALHTAAENLADQPCEVHRDGPVAMIVAPDGYASSWLAVPGLLAQVAEDMGGTVVAIAPDRELLLLVDTDDHDASVEVLEAALDRYQAAPRQLSPVPYLVAESGIAPWEPPSGHPAAPLAEKAAHLLAAIEYAQQRTRLEELLAAEGEDVHVAEHTLMQTENGPYWSWTSWVRQVTDGLLPQADMVLFADNHDPDADFTVPWDDVLRLAGHLLIEDPTCDPPRWRYRDWPDGGTLESLRACAVPFPG